MPNIEFSDKEYAAVTARCGAQSPKIATLIRLDWILQPSVVPGGSDGTTGYASVVRQGMIE
jgi:hypothetical protein